MNITQSETEIKKKQMVPDYVHKCYTQGGQEYISSILQDPEKYKILSTFTIAPKSKESSKESQTLSLNLVVLHPPILNHVVYCVGVLYGMQKNGFNSIKRYSLLKG